MDSQEASYWFDGSGDDKEMDRLERLKQVVKKQVDSIVESREKTIERLSKENDITERELRGCHL